MDRTSDHGPLMHHRGAEGQGHFVRADLPGLRRPASSPMRRQKRGTMPQKYHVAGLGNAIVDVIAAVKDDFLLTHKIAKGAMTLIDEFRAFELHKALVGAGSNHEVAGGSVANSMAGLAS